MTHRSLLGVLDGAGLVVGGVEEHRGVALDGEPLHGLDCGVNLKIK